MKHIRLLFLAGQATTVEGAGVEGEIQTEVLKLKFGRLNTELDRPPLINPLKVKPEAFSNGLEIRVEISAFLSEKSRILTKQRIVHTIFETYFLFH